MKNWSGRNEIIETSGRLHPSWPQNKWLYAPWTKDYRHTRQGRWIQTELAFTFAKNATKPDPVEIISLQTTRKENNWKTKETLARTVVDGTDQTAPILDVYDDDDDSSLIIKYNSSCAYQWQTLKVIGLSTESCQKKL